MLHIDELFDRRQASTTSLVQGKWFRVQWTPDTAAGERLNIGIAFMPKGGRPVIQTIDEFSRLRCFYDHPERAEYHAKVACRVAEVMVDSEPDPLKWVSPQLQILEGGVAQGESVSEVVDRLMVDLVPLSTPKVLRSGRHRPISKKRAYRNIDVDLSFRLGAVYRDHVPKDPKIKTELGIDIFLPFRREGSGLEAATLVSADYVTVDRVQSELFQGHRDISLATEREKFQRGTVFILRPSTDMQPKPLKVAEEKLTEFTRYLTSYGIPHQLGETTGELTEKVSKWCQQVA